ncbi:MAG TPA: SagB/ThcOx family dehydrogenase [Leptolyngbyaceae cyanobacterium M65_K2018_010]|nr:SagB/ThcOx family dehydrogenase [Leptolyngbyaceae cyanobacterium M65_K2018_010]
MPDTSIPLAQHYHDRTKYDPETLSAKARTLDFAHQPVPFKTYQVGVEVDLKPYLDSSTTGEQADADEWMRLSRLLINAYGLTAKFPTPTGQTFYLRSAPSAGGLYPAELYLVSRGTRLLPAGLYNYQARTHSLWRYWDDHNWPALQQACFWHPALEATQMALVVTGVFFRSAWRYQDRAYRRICLDVGHLLGNIELASVLTDYRPHLIASFADELMAQLLYLDPDQEGAMAVLPLADLLAVEQNLPHFKSVFATPCQTDFRAVPDGELLTYFHQSTAIEVTQNIPKWALRPRTEPEPTNPLEDKYNFPFCLRVPTPTAPIAWGEHLQPLETTILKRRSTRKYSGGAISLEALKQLLDFTYQPHHYHDQGFDGDPDYCEVDLLQTFVVVSDVDGLEAGCYYYAPHCQELRQVRFKQFRRELHYLCLGQELGRDAAAVLFHTADLQAASQAYGDRVYRYLHMDAGHLAQRLNLAAIYLGLGVSGIGGFFDDQVNDVLGIPADEAVIYITTLGQPG